MKLIVPITVILCLSSCEQDFLEKKPDKAIVVPHGLNDLQAILDNNEIMNKVPALNMVASDNFYVTDNAWYALLTPAERNSYIWATDIYEGTVVPDWTKMYEQVFYANIVLDKLDDITPETSEQNKWDQLRGSALFYRASAFYHLAQLFAAPFDEETAAQLPGIILRLNANVHEKSSRATLQQTHQQIVKDLIEATPLLPEPLIYSSRPCRAAAKALLARVYLVMGNYDQAAKFAGTCLESNNRLIDYNNLDPEARRPFPRAIPEGNEEMLFYSAQVSKSYPRSAIVDSALYQSYHTNDLRKVVYFVDRGEDNIQFKGNYTGIIPLFGGLTTDEVYLILAECYARQGKVQEAMATLNNLLEKRWKEGTFAPLVAESPEEALHIILVERRKELISRGLRWTDLRRLNTDPRFAVTLKRELNGKTYTLTPGDKRYTFPLPNQEIRPGVEQNPR